LNKETKGFYALTGTYLLLYPFLLGSSSIALPLIPAAYLIKEKRRYPIFFLGLLGDLFFSTAPFGLYTLFLLIGFWFLKKAQRALFVDSLFALAINVYLLALWMNSMQLIYLLNFESIFTKEFIFDPLKQALFALFAYTLPILAAFPKEQKSLNIFRLKQS
jgi:hypothetical protein